MPRQRLRSIPRESATQRLGIRRNGALSAVCGVEQPAKRESGTAKLEEAIAAEALKERTRERVPPDWATSFGYEGIALMFLAERRGDAVMADTALSQINRAFETMCPADHS
jgi:hypothetical protein